MLCSIERTVPRAGLSCAGPAVVSSQLTVHGYAMQHGIAPDRAPASTLSEASRCVRASPAACPPLLVTAGSPLTTACVGVRGCDDSGCTDATPLVQLRRRDVVLWRGCCLPSSASSTVMWTSSLPVHPGRTAPANWGWMQQVGSGRCVVKARS